MAFKYLGNGILANCPDLVSANPNNAVLNVASPRARKFAARAVAETAAMFFPPELDVSPVVHLGGEQINIQCLDRDPAVQNALKNDGLTLNQAIQRLYEEVQKQSPRAVLVYNENVLKHYSGMPTHMSLIHFTQTNARDAANAAGLRQIGSTNLFTHLMHPAGGHHYFWQDTWHDLYRQNAVQGAKAGLGLGGGVIQTGANCYARACEQHAFQRAFGACDNLWRGAGSGGWGSSGSYQSLGCRFERAGIGNGPLEIGAPCPGYFGRQL